jgi:hypothetical protein
MSGTKTDVKTDTARRDKAIAAHKSAADAQKAVAVEPMMVGYDETQPNQVEVVAGSVEHVSLLNSYPNATTYAADVNVVIVDPPPGGGDPMLASQNVHGTTLQPAEPLHDNKSKK